MSAPTSSSILRAGACRQGRYDLSTLSERQRLSVHPWPLSPEDYALGLAIVDNLNRNVRLEAGGKIDPPP
jgi:hypothetical protein